MLAQRAARRYSEGAAYEGDSFPVTEGDSRCVLCQQELQPEAKDRLSRFEEFVTDDTQGSLQVARDGWDEVVSTLEGLRCSPEAVTSNLADVSTDHSDLSAEVEDLLRDYETARTAILEAARKFEELPEREFDGGCSSRLKEAAKRARDKAESLKRPEGIEKALGEIEHESAELGLLKEVKKNRADILHEIERRKERFALDALKTAAATTGISKQVTNLSKDSITEVVRDRFTRESQDLKLERITMETRARKGSLIHKPKLLGVKQTVPVPRVFSEGEKTALGLAAFFTEAELDASKSALILDDPVSSLDHIRRGVVAGRLVSFAQSRQVVVFTHDAAFVADLKREAAATGLGVTEMSVCRSRGGDKKPGRCQSKHPWDIQDVPRRLDELRTQLARMKKDCDQWDATEYANRVELWAGRLSQLWERIFSQEVVGQILGNGGTQVRVQMVRLLVGFSEDDYRQFDASYSNTSKWAPRHDKSALVGYVPPEIDELEQELERVDGWYKRVKKYKNWKP